MELGKGSFKLSKLLLAPCLRGEFLIDITSLIPTENVHKSSDI